MNREKAIMTVYRIVKREGDKNNIESFRNAMNSGNRRFLEVICKSYGYPIADAVDSHATAGAIAKYINDCTRAVN